MFRSFVIEILYFPYYCHNTHTTFVKRILYILSLLLYTLTSSQPCDKYLFQHNHYLPPVSTRRQVCILQTEKMTIIIYIPSSHGDWLMPFALSSFKDIYFNFFCFSFEFSIVITPPLHRRPFFRSLPHIPTIHCSSLSCFLQSAIVSHSLSHTHTHTHTHKKEGVFCHEVQ